MEWTKYTLLELKIKKGLIRIMRVFFLYFTILGLLSCNVSNEHKIKELQKSYYARDYNKIEQVLSSGITFSPFIQNDLLRISLEINKDPKSTLLLLAHLKEADLFYKSQTVLYWALKLNDYESAKALIAKGADLFSCNNGDMLDTPFNMALNTKNQNFIDWLIKEYFVSQDLDSATVYKVFSGFLNKGYAKEAEYVMQNPKLKMKLLESPDLASLIVNNFYNKENESVIDELKNCELRFDKKYAYFHLALLLEEKDISSLIKWLEKNHVRKNLKYYFTDHPCTVGNEYTSPAEFSALLAHFYSKAISSTDEIDSYKISKYNMWSAYFDSSDMH
ncbi:MAG: ankyrin repeat domain-containing protein [Treponema sp.]|nr:ankyrin repeat domain-containing protein [Treponema sp.]